MRSSASKVFTLMCIAFVSYSAIIYTMPLRDNRVLSSDKEQAARGKLVWQKYNCQVCHQLYGLGGYLGPDLTNILSQEQEGEATVRSVVRSGVRQMPAFDVSEEELSGLVKFLRHTSDQGVADPRNFQVNSTGMIECK